MKVQRLNQALRFFICLVIFSNSYSFAAIHTTPEVQKFTHYMVRKYNYSPSYMRWILRKANYDAKVIRHMEREHHPMTWHAYRTLFITQKRIEEGVNYWNRSNKLLAWQEKDYGVPANIIVALIGIESDYGADMGHYRILDSLATLAFYYPPRAKFFQQELTSYLLYTRANKISPTALYGSFAGAIGQMQFMPSSMLHYAVDFHGRGRANVFRDKADVIFSVGNFLRQHHWEPGQPIAVPAKITGHSYHRFLKKDLRTPKEPQFSLAQLAQYGIHPASGAYPAHYRANLIKLQGFSGPEYWLTFQNFYVLTRYNNNDLYAMAVFQLGQQIRQAYKNKN